MTGKNNEYQGEQNIGSVAAEYCQTYRFSQHYGVEYFDSRCIVYGNDGFDSPRTQREVSLIREAVQREGFTEVAFGTSLDGYSWALVLDHDTGVNAKRILFPAVEAAATKARSDCIG